MAAEVVLIGVAKLALEEGVKFLYEQAREFLTAWRARRKDPSAPPPVAVPAPEQVTVGKADPLSDPPREEVVVALQELKDLAEGIKDGTVDADSEAGRRTIAELRDLVEGALRAPITFSGEASRPVQVSDIDVIAQRVTGDVAGLRADLAKLQSGAEIRRVRVQAGDVEREGKVTGVDLT